MPNTTVRVGIIGTGFGQAAMIPGFKNAPGAEIVAVTSGRLERAQAAAQQHGIPHAFSDYRQMLDQVPLDIVAIVTPVSTHHPMALAAIERGVHVLCEKPTAMDTAEAVDMYAKAHARGLVHLIDHELRFNPSRRRMRELLREGFIGQPYHVNIQIASGGRADPNQPWSWWSSKAMGGGAVGASASHQVDSVRWWLGQEFKAVTGELRTFVQRRPDAATGEWKPVDSDDFFVFLGELEDGTQVTVQNTSVVRLGTGMRAEIHGSEGSLVLDAQERLLAQRAGEKQPADLTLPDPNASLPGVQPGPWNVSFVSLAREMVAAVQEGRQPTEGATFWDGVRIQAILDAIRQSHEQRRWVDVQYPV